MEMTNGPRTTANSAVIGVVLMVAITVALSSVVGLLVLDIGQTAAPDSTPHAGVSFTPADDGSVTVRLTDESDASRVVVRDASGMETSIAQVGGEGTVHPAGQPVTVLAESEDGTQALIPRYEA